MGKDKDHSVNRGLILASLKSGTGGFEKVNGMIDGMHEVLDKAKEEAKTADVDVEDVKAAIDQERDSIEKIAAEIEEFKKGLEELDKDVAEAREQWKDEHAQYINEAASNLATVELLGMAKNRLNKFDNTTLHEAPDPVAEEEEFFA